MTKYCNRIKTLSCLTWSYLSDVFSYKLKVSEIGITNHLIFDIARYYKRFPKGSEIYCFHGKYEKYRGADIDLFIQTSNGEYNHFMLQAKVMDFNGYYKDISKYKTTAQFLTLINRSKKEKALALYLLYNGSTPKSKKGKHNLGLSIITAKRIKKIRFDQDKNGYKKGENYLSFDLLANDMQPYSNLFCGGIKKVTLPPNKKEEDIYTGFPYQLITKNGTDFKQDTSYGKRDKKEKASSIIQMFNLAPIRVIIKYDDINE